MMQYTFNKNDISAFDAVHKITMLSANTVWIISFISFILGVAMSMYLTINDILSGNFSSKIIIICLLLLFLLTLISMRVESRLYGLYAERFGISIEELYEVHMHFRRGDARHIDLRQYDQGLKSGASLLYKIK